MTVRCAAIGILAMLALSLTPKSTTAAQPPPGDSGERIVVMIASMEEEEKSPPIVRATQGQLSDMDVHLRLVSVDALEPSLEAQIEYAHNVVESYGAIAAFWCDVTENGRVTLLVLNGDGEQLMARRLSGTDGGGYAEELAIIVRSAVEELTAGGTIGVGPAPRPASTSTSATPPPGPESSPPNPPTQPRAQRLKISTAYAPHAYNEDNLVVHGFDLSLVFLPARILAVTAGYTFTSPVNARGASMSMHLRRHPLHLGVRAELPLERFHLGVSLRAVLDIATLEDISLDAGMTISDDDGALSLGLLPAVEAGLRINHVLGLFAAVGAEFSLVTRHYTSTTATGSETVLDAWPVMPWMMIGVFVHLI